MYIVAGLLVGLGLPRASFGISGCTNANLTGTYNAQISSANFMNVLSTINGSAASAHDANLPPFGGPTGFGTGLPPSTSTGGTGGGNTGGGTTGSVTVNPGGFGNNPNSLSGQTPGLGRYFFDGSGNIVGLSAGPNSGNVMIGSYSVNSDCTAAMTLNSGQTFTAVLAQNGGKVLFIETDSSAIGATGELDLATTGCNTMGGTPLNFAFSFFGAKTAAASSGSAVSWQQNSAIGALFLDGQGGFNMTEWMSANGSIQPLTSSGTYAIGLDCSIKLTFAASSNGGTTGSTSGLPMAFRGLLVSDSAGLIAVQPDQTLGDTVTGVVINQ